MKKKRMTKSQDWNPSLITEADKDVDEKHHTLIKAKRRLVVIERDLKSAEEREGKCRQWRDKIREVESEMKEIYNSILAADI